MVDQELKQAMARAGESRVSTRMESDERTVRITARNERLYPATMERLERAHSDTLQRLKQAAEVRRQSLSAASEEQAGKLTAAYDASWQSLEAEWQSRTSPLYEAINSANTAAEKLFPPWGSAVWKSWSPPRQFAQAAEFAQLQVDLEKLCEALPQDKRLGLPGPARFSLPLCLAYPEQGSILLETGNAGHEQAIGALNNIILRLLSAAPPGRLNFTIIDPGRPGAELRRRHAPGRLRGAAHQQPHLDPDRPDRAEAGRPERAHGEGHPDVSAQRIRRPSRNTTSRPASSPRSIISWSSRISRRTSRDTAAKRLLSIAASGARCGVYMLIHWDQRQPLPAGFHPG